MERIMEINALMGIALAILLFALPATLAGPEIPTDISALSSWFSEAVKPLESRKSDLDVNLATAEASPVVIKVRKDGSGQYKTVQEAVNNVKLENKVRTIIDIGPGDYNERIKVDRFKSYITFIGDPENRPKLTSSGNAAKFGTFDSATLIVEAEYFVASNIIFENTAPRPKLDTKDGQALAVRIQAEKGTFYNCRFLGFQDTLCDDIGKHFFKDCYIEGTVDFIFGSGQSIYLNCEVYVHDGDIGAIITAQNRNNDNEGSGYVFVHGNVTGKGAGTATLGRSWKPSPKVLFLYVNLGDAVNPVGWSDNSNPETQKTVYFGEWKNTGPKSDLSKRVGYMKKVTEAEAKPYMTLDYIEASKWLLPPPIAKGGAASPGGGAPGAAPAGAAAAPGGEAPSEASGAAPTEVAGAPKSTKLAAPSKSPTI